MKQINDWVDQCSCGQHHAIQIENILVEPSACLQIPAFVQRKSYRHIVMVCDEWTFQVAGESIQQSLLQQGLTCKLIMLRKNELADVIADEISVVQILTETDVERTDVFLAVGTGTIHDLVRFVASKVVKPFISVPTAPSVDGFTSIGAPLIIRGEKITLPAVAPIAIFADLVLLSQAPKALIAAGFADMLAKYVSLIDWKFSHRIAGEPYCEAVAHITANALQRCVSQVNAIASLEVEGIHALITALIESGLAMLIFGQSHPASGAEHHVSHYWEMIYLRTGRKQLLHGAKVGVATILISHFYHQLASKNPWSAVDPNHAEQQSEATRIQENWSEITSWIASIPSTKQIMKWLQAVGAPVTAEALGIDHELLQESMQHAYRVRNRYTLMRAYREFEPKFTVNLNPSLS